MTDLSEQIKYQKLTLADLGRQYPPEFISSIADNAAAVVSDWLEKNNAPGALTELFSSVIILYQLAGRAEGDKLSDQDAAGLPEFIAATTKLIATCGGCFYSESGTIPTQPPANS